MDGWLGVVIMIGLGLGFAGTMIGLSMLLGPKNPTPEKLAPYECGMPAVGDARERHSVKFYRSEEHTSELQSHRDLHSFPTRRSSDLMLLGPKNPTPEKLAPYECGMPAVGDARERHSVKFY